MKFDVGRTAELFNTFAPDRTSRTGGDRIAAELLAEDLEGYGYQVVRNEVNARPFREVVGLIVTCFGLWFLLSIAMYFTFLSNHSSFVTRLGPMLGAFVWAFLIGNAAKSWPDFGIGRSVSENVVAMRPDPTAPVRVTFFTSLDNPPPILQRGLIDSAYRWFISALTAGIFMTPFPWWWLPLPIRFVLFTLTAVLSGVCLLLWLPWRLQRGRSGATTDNRDGLAFLTELARTWPKRYHERIEAVFVAVGSSDDRSGTRDLLLSWLNSWPEKPTLFLGCWSPGLAPPLGIETNSDPSMKAAKAAAEGLRVPHEIVVNPRSVWGHRGQFPNFVGLIGMDRSRLMPESLAHVAQLATEIALRWAREETELRNAQALGKTAARSSQNPG